jgi:hypothetical protein
MSDPQGRSQIEIRMGLRWWALTKIVWRVGGYCDTPTLCALICTRSTMKGFLLHDNVWKETFFARCHVDARFAEAVIVPLGSPRRIHHEQQLQQLQNPVVAAAPTPSLASPSRSHLEAAREVTRQAISSGLEGRSSPASNSTISAPNSASMLSTRENSSSSWCFVNQAPPPLPPCNYFEFFRDYILSPKLLEGYWCFDADSHQEREEYPLLSARVVVTRATFGLPGPKTDSSASTSSGIDMGAPPQRHYCRIRLILQNKSGTNLYDGLLKYSPKQQVWVAQMAGPGCNVRGPSYIVMLSVANRKWPNQLPQQFSEQQDGPRLLLIPKELDRGTKASSAQAPDHGIIAVGRSPKHPLFVA